MKKTMLRTIDMPMCSYAAESSIGFQAMCKGESAKDNNPDGLSAKEIAQSHVDRFYKGQGIKIHEKTKNPVDKKGKVRSAPTGFAFTKHGQMRGVMHFNY